VKCWLSAALLTVGALTIAVHAQSLADIARKTEEQRSDKEKPKAQKVYTNKDLDDGIVGGIGDTPDARFEPPAEAEPISAIQTSAPKDETYWRDRMRSVYERLDSDQAFLVAVSVREQVLDKRLHRDVDDVLYIRDHDLRALVESDWTLAVAEVGRLKAAVENDKRALSTAEEEARRADVPSSWLIRVQ
jgi:hypothetical protein